MCGRGLGVGMLAIFSLYIYIENFKNLLVSNHETNFYITWQKSFLGDPLPRLFKPSLFVEKHGGWVCECGVGVVVGCVCVGGGGGGVGGL